jgi:hypothetical protein
MTVNYSSLREATLKEIGNFLFVENFKTNIIARQGILDLINLISDYYEEGTHLFPEVVIMNKIGLLKTIPSRAILMYDGKLNILEFKQAIKLCAPLAVNDWVIFIVINGTQMKYGLTSAEISETSIPMFKQAIEMPNNGFKIAYIRNVGRKTVELAGLNNRCVISLTLDETKEVLKNEIFELCSVILSKSVGNDSSKFTTFFEKLISEAIKIGHGNLISVVDDSVEAIEKTSKVFKNGVFLKEPIDLAEMIKRAENEKTNLTSIELKSFSALVISMLNHDGITLFSNNGKVLGYHFIIENTISKKAKTDGGSRTLAFESMKGSNLFQACFMKSQDGNIKFYKK